MDKPEIIRNEKGHFLPGEKWSGNMAGRPKGSRNKLAESFIDDLYADWSEHGKTALKECREQNPAVYVRTVASLLPKDITLTVNATEQLTDEELASGLLAVRQALAARERASTEGGEVIAH